MFAAPDPRTSRMPAIRHRALGLLSGLAAALAMLPASAQGADACIQGAHDPATGCARSSQAQLSFEQATTTQKAESEARARQTVGHADDAGGEASNRATSSAENSAGTKQSSDQSGDAGIGRCSIGCGAGTQTQVSGQISTTTQMSASEAEAEQDVSDADLPVNASGSDGRDLSNGAHSEADNRAQTIQSNGQSQQEAGSSCSLDCRGTGQMQRSLQQSTTTQAAESDARATQNISNPNSADREASNTATSGAYNTARTKQINYQSQESDSSSCSASCGVDNQAQVSEQSVLTTQTAASKAQANPSATGLDVSANSDGAVEAATAESNATTQLIWQVQLSECIAHCVGTRQSQSAEQHSNTVQVLNGLSQAGSARGSEVGENGPPAGRNVTQIQLGCVLHCFGTTSTTSAPMLASYVQAVEQTLRSIGIAVSTLVATAAEQNTVEQISYQSQRGPRGVAEQTQSVSQTSTAVQEYDASSPITGLQQILESSPAASPQVVNQTGQGIWQLQLGCLMFCSETALYQRAAQSSSTGADAGAPETASSSTSSSTQLIWQAQIGCLLWCFDSTEQQTAVPQNMPVVREGEGTPVPTLAEAPAPVPGEAPAPSPSLSFPLDVTDELTYVSTLAQSLSAPAPPGVVTDTEHPLPAPGAVDSPSVTVASAAVDSASVTVDISPTSTGTSTAAPASPAAALEEGSTMTATTGPTHRAAPHLPALQHGREARATPGFVRQPVNVQLAHAAPHTGVRRSIAEVAGVAHLPAAAPTLSDTARRSGMSATFDIPLATLLSAFALCGLCVFGIALAAARRDLCAGKPGAGG